MAEIIKDAEDRLLESLLAAEPIADDGFSKRVVGRIRRRLWVRRLVLPFAAAIGGAIAFKPLAALVTLAVDVLNAMPADYVATTVTWIPPLHLVVAGGMLLAAVMLGMRMLID